MNAAEKAAEILVRQPFFQNSHKIACYLAREDEFASMPIIQAVWQAKKECYLPVLSTTKEKALDFVLYHEGDALHFNRYKILEPKNVHRTISLSHLDIVLTPLIAFDIQGHRLGTGSGYYDRTFAFLNTEEGQIKKPLLIGLAYAFQGVEQIPPDPWDIRLAGVITEKGWMEFG